MMVSYKLQQFCYGILLLTLACSEGPAARESVAEDPEVSHSLPDTSDLVVAGQRLGTLQILDRMDTVIHKLGTPDFSDSGAGTTVSRYRLGEGDADLVLILTFEPEDSMRKDLQVARTTASRFRDVFGIGVGSGRDSIDAHYALQSPAAVFLSGNDSLRVYNTGEGLTFELDAQGICRGLAVHAVDRKPTAHYRADYPEMKIIDPPQPVNRR